MYTKECWEEMEETEEMGYVLEDAGAGGFPRVGDVEPAVSGCIFYLHSIGDGERHAEEGEENQKALDDERWEGELLPVMQGLGHGWSCWRQCAAVGFVQITVEYLMNASFEL